nr:unnamed protein product [Callosobruchus analis]
MGFGFLLRKMLFRTLFLLQIFLKISIQNDASVASHFIKEFCTKQNVSTNIAAFICWPKDIMFNFWKTLSKDYSTIVMRNRPLIYSPTDQQHQLYFIDMRCSGYKNILNQAQDDSLFRDPIRFILWEARSDQLEPYYFRVDSRVYTVVKQNEKYITHSVYKIGESSTEILENFIGVYDPTGGFTTFSDVAVFRNRSNLSGLEVNVTYVATNPETLEHLEDYRQNHVDPLTKVNWIRVGHLFNMFNITYNKIWVNTWGYRDNETNKFSGMLGDLQSGTSEFGGTQCFYTYDRIDYVDFIPAWTPTFMKFIFSFVLCAIIFIIIYLIVSWEWKNKLFRKKVEKTHGALKPDILEVAIMEMGAITQQGSDTEPRSSAGRVAYFIALISLMFLYTSYSANIVALLQSTTENIRTVEDLLNSRISLGALDVVYNRYYFEHAQDPIRKAIYQQKIAPKGQKAKFISLEEGMSRVRDEFFGFHSELSVAYKIVADTFRENEKCALKEVAYVNMLDPHMVIRKRSAYKELVKIGSQRILESGLQRREEQKIYMKKPVCHSKGSNFGSAGIVDCYAAFLIFGIGLGISFTIFSLELLYRKYKERKTTMLFKILFLLQIVFKISFQNDASDASAFLRDFCLKQNKSSNIIAYVCWNKGTIFRFWKSLSKDYSTMVTRKSELIYFPTEEHQLYFLDMRCAGSEDILNQV